MIYPFGLSPGNYNEVIDLLCNKHDKQAAAETLKTYTGLSLQNSAGILDMITSYHEKATRDTLFTLTKDMMFQDDFTQIHDPSCENCHYEWFNDKLGREKCTQDISDIYQRIYDNITDPKEKEDVETWIFGNLLHHSPDAIKDAIDNYANVRKHLKELDITPPRCMQRKRY